MTISFTCPHCQHTTEVADSYAGQSGPCASCGKTVTVPGGDARPATHSSGTNVVLIVLGVCLLLLLVCGGGMAALLVPAIGAAREAARRTECQNNLRQIGLAMHGYHDTYKTFPPAYIPDENGQPMTSWRVLILPFLEQSYLYDSYDFHEPWDNPNNLAVTDVDLPVYQCPSDGTSSCNYFVVNVPGGIFDGSQANRIANVTDGTSNTIMVVESVGANVHWAEPVDLGPAAVNTPINGAKNGTAISSNHAGGAVVVFADGSSRVLTNEMVQQILPLLINRKDGQPIPNF